MLYMHVCYTFFSLCHRIFCLLYTYSCLHLSAELYHNFFVVTKQSKLEFGLSQGSDILSDKMNN